MNQSPKESVSFSTISANLFLIPSNASVTRVIFSFHLIEIYTMNCIFNAQVIHLFSRVIFLLLLFSAENLHTVRIKII